MDINRILKTATPLVVIFLLLTTSYCYFNGENEYKIAVMAQDSNDLEGAVMHFSRSISWYVPFSSYIDDSARRILSIAEHHEMNGETEDAKHAYNSLRAALFSVRSTHLPREDYLQRCNDKIAGLNAISITQDDAGEDFEKAKSDQLRVLSENPGPDMFWSSLVSLSFLGWVTMTLILIFNLFKNNVVKFNSNVIIILILLSIFYIVWLISLIKA